MTNFKDEILLKAYLQMQVTLAILFRYNKQPAVKQFLEDSQMGLMAGNELRRRIKAINMVLRKLGDKTR